MTGSGSKCNEGIYHYYRCQRKYGCTNSFPAKEANEHFIIYLKSFEVSEDILSLYHFILQDIFYSDDKAIEVEKLKLENEIENISKKLRSLHMKFIDDEITPQDYKELKSSLEDRKNDLVGKHLTINKMDREFSKYTTYGLSLLKNISGYYQQAPGEVKSKIISSIFPENLIYEEKSIEPLK